MIFTILFTISKVYRFYSSKDNVCSLYCRLDIQVTDDSQLDICRLCSIWRILCSNQCSCIQWWRWSYCRRRWAWLGGRALEVNLFHIILLRRRWKGLDLGCCSPETQAHSRGFWPSLGSDHLPFLARKSTRQWTGCTWFWYGSRLHCYVQAIPDWGWFIFLMRVFLLRLLARVQWLSFRLFEYLSPAILLRPLNMIHSNPELSYPVSMVTMFYMK